jgi:hypothetical protein
MCGTVKFCVAVAVAARPGIPYALTVVLSVPEFGPCFLVPTQIIKHTSDLWNCASHASQHDLRKPRDGSDPRIEASSPCSRVGGKGRVRRRSAKHRGDPPPLSGVSERIL